MLAGASLGAEASSSSSLSVNEFPRNGLFRAHLLVSFESRNRSPSARLRSLLLRVFAGHASESSRIESCGTDVADVLADDPEGPVDKPRTTIRT